MTLDTSDLQAIRSIVNESESRMTGAFHARFDSLEEKVVEGFNHQSKALHALQSTFVDREEFDQLKAEVEELKDFIASLGPATQ